MMNCRIEDQPEAFSAHLDFEKHPDPPPRPCAQAQGLERRAGSSPLADPAVCGFGSAAAPCAGVNSTL